MEKDNKKLAEELKKAEAKIRLNRRAQDRTDWVGNHPEDNQ